MITSRVAAHGSPITVEETAVSPHGWRWRLLNEVARLESGHTPSRRHPEWWGGDVPWIALPDIRSLDGREAFATTEQINELGLANSSARLLPKGTVVLSRTASVGFVTVMGRPMATSQDFVNWVCGPELMPWFLAHALLASRDYLRSLAAGAIHKTIYMPMVRSFRTCMPPLELQKAILKRIEQARSVVHHARASIHAQSEAIDRLEPAVLRAAFQGRL
ncbi:MAG: restriction endonuclease subunit S [Microvirga sp.]